MEGNLDDTLTGFNALSLGDSTANGRESADKVSQEPLVRQPDGMGGAGEHQKPQLEDSGVDQSGHWSPKDGESANGLESIQDDDVLYVGSSITVKTEGAPSKRGLGTLHRDLSHHLDDSQGHSMAEPMEKFQGQEKSGWIVSCVKSPKASLKHLVSKRVVGLDSVNLGQDGNLTHINALCQRGSNSSTIVSNRSGKSAKMHKNSDYARFNGYDRAGGHADYGKMGEQVVPRHGVKGYIGEAQYGQKSYESHGISPESLNRWLMALLKAFIIITVIYIIAITTLAIKRDIDNEIQKKRRMIKDEVLECQELYKKNQCSTLQIPALEEQCKKWESCMYKNELLYEETTSLSAEFLGGIINKFVSQLELRTVAIVMFTLVALLIGYNLMLSLRLRIFGNGNYPGYTHGGQLNFQGYPNHMLHYPPLIQNPYIVPNYFSMGGYPFIHDQRPQLDCYRRDSGSKHVKRGTSAWKRRFTSAWQDE
ncbi:hypothetical protein BEWA_026790 [Theileria equi strain WA]|uniref:Brl1/Brr6 domain-containing protein n=1 Tax=Theileria equi strain WA TaxID=1537102 RepID=L0AWA7_THEEQ|nr:hypothetical protein BEWA_026790 [Theileria equi strain WA]AFZ79830.1 hypothetical protein BEWA_026790 [Theileria equi strain WA]|eukprot:XP_004829496.1 hypothetical protein BEWA_026790 [Theileria equi strain WA]